MEKYHVEEAYRLLSKSIVRVVQDEVEFDQDEDTGLNINAGGDETEIRSRMDVDDDQGDVTEKPIQDDSSVSRIPASSDLQQLDEADEGTIAESQSQFHGSSRDQGSKLKLSFDDYKAMATVILTYMKKEETRLDEEDDGTEDEGLRKSKIIDWYLNEIQDEIENVEQLTLKKTLTEKVIHRLIHHVSCLADFTMRRYF